MARPVSADGQSRSHLSGLIGDRIDQFKFSVDAPADGAATTLSFLRSPPGNRLEPLQGDRQSEWSIRVNDQWRICFRWEDGVAFDVEIIDYH